VLGPTIGATTLLERRKAPVGAKPAEASDVVQIRQTVRPRVMLRLFGEVCVEGTATTQALSVAFAVAAAARSMSGDELAELTGYSRKSLSTVFTSDHDIVDREDGRLRLASGVWTDHGWMLECARRARSADEARDVHEASDWLRNLFAELNRVDAAAYASPPGRQTYWRWVDDFPADVPARMAAESQLVEAALVGGEVWAAAGAQALLPADVVVRTLTQLARAVPHAGVPSAVRPCEIRSSAENLLLAAYTTAAGRGELTSSVQAAARQLVADGAIEASDTLADALGL
jgi:hypothetical protein